MSASIAARFEEIVTLYPDRTVLKTEELDVTFSEFNHEANRIAHAIARVAGEIPPGRLALLFEQGVEGIVAIIGALKSGHAFVPLDVADGSDRMRNIIEDCQPIAVLTDVAHLAAARALVGDRPIICVDELADDLPAGNPGLDVSPDADAYVFYTSGSTGNPKGVRQTQRNLLHFSGVYSDTLGIQPEDRLTLFYSLAFSASNMDVFGALLRGAALYPYDIRKRGTAALGGWLEQNSITILHAVPTVYRHLTRQLPEGKILPTIRGIDLGGEAVYFSDVELHRAHFRPDCVLINHLAATEASVIAQDKIDVSAEAAGEMLPVGPPAQGMEIRILDSAGEPVAAGETGEIVLCSRFISPGYWKRTDLDEKSFGEDTSRPGWRTYRSGDLGYFSVDGKLHFLGRKDHRVKVRGHTVDTSEIEAAIRTLSKVRDVAVVLREDKSTPDSGQLAAFLAGDSTLQQGMDDLRLALRKQLPAYMIPADFIVLESLPSTSSGKIDRKSLEALEIRESREGKSYHVPQNESEEIVAEVFCRLLNLERAGRDEDFFLCGGDSLKATLLHAHLEDRFQKRLALEKLFLDPTVKGIAALADASSGNVRSMPPVIVPLRETGANVPLFLSHGARGQAFVSPHFLSILGDEQPVYALQATGLDLAKVPNNTIAEMAAEYIRAIREVQPHGPYLLGALCIGSLLVVEMAHQLQKAGEAVGPLLLIDPPPNPPGEFSGYKLFRELFIAHYKKFWSKYRLDKEFTRQVKKRAGEGKVRIDVNDQEALKAVQRVTLDFKIALLNYRLPIYLGPALILGSGARLGKTGSDASSILLQRLPGDVRIFNVGGKHGQIHDVGNALFAEQMTKAMAIVTDYFQTQGKPIARDK